MRQLFHLPKTRGSGALVALLLMVSALTGCSTSKPIEQGNVRAERVTCIRRQDQPGFRFDCISPLRSFLSTQPSDTRIAAISPLYIGGSSELLVWLTESAGWPSAQDLEVDEHDCLPTRDMPDCTTTMEEVARATTKHHYFVVPVYGAVDKPRSGGSWSLLDVRRKDAASPRDAGWQHVRIAYLACRLEKGDTYYSDHGDGVMKADASDYGKETEAVEGPGLCIPALINFLRSHPDERIAGVIALDGMRTGQAHKRALDLGTVGLLVLISEETRWPLARSLAVETISCIDDCPGNIVRYRTGLDRMQSSFTVASIMEPLEADRAEYKFLWVRRLQDK